MDEAFVEDAQHDVDDQHGHEQQQPQAVQGFLEGLGLALEAGADRGWQRFPGQGFDALRGLAQGRPGREAEGDGHGGQLARVVHGQRPDVQPAVHEGVQRREPALVRTDVEERQGLGVALEARVQLHDDLVGVVGRVDGGNLAAAVGRGQGVLDLEGADAK